MWKIYLQKIKDIILIIFPHVSQSNVKTRLNFNTSKPSVLLLMEDLKTYSDQLVQMAKALGVLSWPGLSDK